MSSSPDTHLSPGHWALLAALMFGSTLLFILIVVWGVAGGDDRFVRFDAPGVIDLELPSAGRYILYHEFERTPDSKGEVRPGTLDGIIANIQEMPAGERVEMLPADPSARYVIQRIIGEPIYEFVLPRGGTWRLATELKQDAGTAKARLSIIPNPAGRAMQAFYTGLAFQVAALALITLLAYYLRWRSSRTRGSETP